MNITICGSMRFAKEMQGVGQTLKHAGHLCFFSMQVKEYASGQITYDSHEDAQNKITHNLIRDHYQLIEKSDAILVLNYAKKGIEHYIGGNTFLEIGFAYILKKRIYLLNPIPTIAYYQSEIEAMQPIILNGNLNSIK